MFLSYLAQINSNSLRKTIFLLTEGSIEGPGSNFVANHSYRICCKVTFSSTSYLHVCGRTSLILLRTFQNLKHLTRWPKIVQFQNECRICIQTFRNNRKIHVPEFLVTCVYRNRTKRSKDASLRSRTIVIDSYLHKEFWLTKFFSP